MSTIVNNRYAKDIDRFLDYNDIKIININSNIGWQIPEINSI